METENRKSNCNPIDNYKTLSLKQSLSNPSQYILACKELTFILKNAYSQSPKILQSLIFQDALFALTLLPQMATQSAISAANSLLQCAEFALPKQKRALAVAEYKRAVVASKRKAKANQDEQGLTMLPHDVLVHIFSFLDVQSVVSSSAVCRSWNAAANDSHLWKSFYVIFFSNSDIVTKHKTSSLDHTSNGVGIDWRCSFKRSYKETCYRKFKSYRGYCLSCCSIVWISRNQCSNKPSLKDDSKHQIKPISIQQIVEYIFNGWPLLESSSDSDSDDEDVPISKLWAYRWQIG